MFSRILLSLLIFSSFSCYALSDSLYPLNVGMYWVYEIDGSENRETNKIVSTKSIQGNEWYELIEYGETYWVRNGEAGQLEAVSVFDENAASEQTVEEITVFKYPLQLGESYSSGIDIVKVVGEKVITVPAGTFRCTIYHIQMSGEDYSRNCIAKGVGVVENEFFSEGELSVSRLVEYGVE